MSKKVKYRLNPESLQYDKVFITWRSKLYNALITLIAGLFFAFIFMLILSTFYNTPKEYKLKRELKNLSVQYDILKNRVDYMNDVITELEERDNNIYRLIFEAEPTNLEEGKNSFAQNYKKLEGFDYSGLIISSAKSVDELQTKLYKLSKSYDEMFLMAVNKEELNRSIPAILPLAVNSFKRISSGFGYRIHPIYKYVRFHEGIDFSAEQGTKIHVSGDGVVESVEYSSMGYGNHVVINHGFGYKTIYGHCHEINVRLGRKVKRGDVIATVGNTGLSTAPHLHYEVRRNNKPVNPINYFFHDISSEEYNEIVNISSNVGQALD